MAFGFDDPMVIEIKAGDAVFTAVGTIPTFQGFMILYVEGEDNSQPAPPTVGTWRQADA
jgi:DNA topoisomerase IA